MGQFLLGLINLLPVYPLDGGQAAQAVFEHSDPVRGRRRSLIVSVVVAGALALFGLAEHSYYLFLLFAMLAASSIQAFDAESGRLAPRPYRR